MTQRRAGAAPAAPPPDDAQGGSESGLVLASYRRHFAVRVREHEVLECVLRGRSLAVVCGDTVRLQRMAGGGAIESIEPRSTLFYRSDGFREKLIAANVTQVIGVVSPDLTIDEELLTRWSVAAEAQSCRFIIVANKKDKPGFDRLLARLRPFADLGYAVVALSAVHDVTPLIPHVSGEKSVLIGQSGMGKSTILNALTPEASARTGEISESLATGRHTTTHAMLYPLPESMGGGWIVDSPGIKAFGVAHLDPEAIVQAFREFRPLLGECRFRDCRHDREPGCALQSAVEHGQAAPHRLDLLRTLVADSKAARSPTR
ncbi:MAG: ribosome small subunit-dependent GTPase A [Pseudomonadota bacterium]|nr:ribosome small subunit-dependent GTPase A [Pseudomonadota bacterium]